jgi:hypothetical protein
MSGYIRIREDNSRQYLSGKPSWFFDDGLPVSDEWLILNDNTYPIVDQSVDQPYDGLKEDAIDDWVLVDEGLLTGYIQRTFTKVFNNFPEYDSFYQFLQVKDDSVWETDVDGNLLKTYDIISKDFETKKTEIINELEDIRWNYEVGGLSYTVSPSGTPELSYNVYTDRESQGKMTGIFFIALNELDTNNRAWKTMTGFVDFTPNQIINMGQTMLIFVQSCYDCEKVILYLINQAETISDLKIIYNEQFNTGWPSNAVFDQSQYNYII